MTLEEVTERITYKNYKKYHAENLDREFVIMTGRLGWDRIHNEIRKSCVEDTLDHYLQSGKLTLCEYLRLNELIESEDRENLGVVEAIIQEKFKTI